MLIILILTCKGNKIIIELTKFSKLMYYSNISKLYSLVKTPMLTKSIIDGYQVSGLCCEGQGFLIMM